MHEGINDVKVEHSGGGTTKIRILSDDTLITISENSTHIQSNGKEKLRLKLRDLIMKCVPNFWEIDQFIYIRQCKHPYYGTCYNY